VKLSISPRVWPKIAHFSPKFCSSRNSKSGCEIDGTSERPQQTPDSLEPASCKLSLQNITSTCGLITNPSRHPSTVRNRPYYRLCSHGGFSGSCNSASKLAVQRRYNMTVFLCVLSGSLQGIAVRPLPCHYNRFQFFSALSRRYHGFKSRRGRQIFSVICANFLRISRYNDGTTWFRADHAHHLALSRPLVRAQRLGVGVQGHAGRGMPQ